MARMLPSRWRPAQRPRRTQSRATRRHQPSRRFSLSSLKEKAPEVRGLFLLDPLFTYAYEDISGPTPIYDTQQPTTMPETNVLSNVILPRMRLAIPFLVLSFYLTAYAQ